MVGLSVGGLIAQGLAALHPERIAALVLSNTAHKIGTEASWNERIATVEAGGVAAVADIVMQRWFTPTYRRPDNADFIGYRTMFVRTPVDGYVGTCASVRDADLTESTRALKAADALHWRRPGRHDATRYRALDGRSDPQFRIPYHRRMPGIFPVSSSRRPSPG